MEFEFDPVDMTKVKESRVPVVWVIGGPGSGRGTQCENLQASEDYVHLSTGQLLRQEVLSGSKYGLAIFKLMEMGEVVPAEMVIHLLAKNMAMRIEGCKGFLIDGYPMDIQQAEKFERLVVPVTRIVHLNLCSKVMMDRLKKRQNFDDLKPGSIEKRIKTYKEKTLPVVKKYVNKVIHVEAQGTEDEVKDKFYEALTGPLKSGGRPILWEDDE